MPSPALLASVEVPASSANLGSGFDCFAAALSLKLRAELFRGDEAGILLEAHGEGAPAPDADPEQNLVIRAFRAGLRTAGGASVGSGWNGTRRDSSSGTDSRCLPASCSGTPLARA